MVSSLHTHHSILRFSVTLVLLSVLCGSQLRAQDIIYLSPTGNDAHAGTSDQPMATLEQASKSPLWTKSTTDTLFILLKAGEYNFPKTQTITTPPRRPVVIRGTGSSNPRISGGIKVSGWQQYKKGIYRAPWPMAGGKYVSFEQLFVNGHRATLARTPNTGWGKVQSFSQQEQDDDKAVRIVEIESSHHKALQQLKTEERNRVRLHLLQKWNMLKWSLSEASLSPSAITFTKCSMGKQNPVKKGTRYIIENYRGALDAPGEWFADAADHYVYYIPRQGENMATAEVIAPVLDKLLVIKGKQGKPVKDITIEGIDFCHSAHIMPQAGERVGQAMAHLGAAVEMSHAEGITVRRCIITGTGEYALWLKEKVSGCTVRECTMTDLGAGGVKVGHYSNVKRGQTVSNHNTIDNNVIADGGHVTEAGVGILVLRSADNSITHNHIHHLYYTGISVGWTWGYNTGSRYNPTVGNHIAYNLIHDIGQGMLSDMGGIYLLGEEPGTVVENNVVHDVRSYDYGGMGIYTDQGASYITIRNNLVYRCSEACFQQHYGKENNVENNIFAFASKYVLMLTKNESQVPFTFRRNIVVSLPGVTFIRKGSWLKSSAKMEGNLYWNNGGTSDFASLDFSQYRNRHEKKAVEADPMFVDAQRGNFHFRSKANAERIGFKPFNYEEAGVYGSMAGKGGQTSSAGVSVPAATSSGTIHFPF